MKKIIATILIMIFTTNMSALANGVLTIDKAGNIKYEEGISINSNSIKPQNSTSTEAANTISQPEKQNLKAKKSLSEANANNVSLASKTTQQQETKINVKNIDMNDETLKKYHQKFYKYSNRAYSYSYKNNMDKYLKGYKYYNYPEKDNFDKNDKYIMRFELQDGDYAILDNSVKGNKKYKYAAEYHKDGSLFGVVQIKTIRKIRKSATIAFYEYRQSEENLSKFNTKHTMFLDIEKEKDKVNIAQFVYKDKISFESLVCAQVNNDLYLNEESKNLIVKMKKFDEPKPSFSGTQGGEIIYIIDKASFVAGYKTRNLFHEVGDAIIEVPLVIFGYGVIMLFWISGLFR